VKEFDNMVEGEQFVSVIASIEGLPIRLESIELKMSWKDTMSELRNSLSSISAACDEVLTSQGLKRFLALLLLIGNYMCGTSGSKEVYGFELNVLPTLNGIKEKSGDETLLHTLIGMMEKGGGADCIAKELQHVEKASRIDLQEITRVRDVAKSSHRKISTHVVSYKVQVEQDRFLEKMQPFVEKAAGDLTVLDAAWDEMNAKWTRLQNYLSLDAKKYSMGSLFSDLKTFMDHYELIRRELEAKHAPQTIPRRPPLKSLQATAITNQPRIPRVNENHGIMDQIERFLESNNGGPNTRGNKARSRRQGDENFHGESRTRSNKDHLPSTEELSRLLRGL